MIDRLVELLPPPRRPRATGSADKWPAVEAALGTRLPADYKQFISLYGAGRIDNEIGIVSPFSSAGSLQERLARRQETNDVYVAQLGYSPIPYSVYPVPGGLLPWGHTANGDVLSWVTSGDDPGDWVVFVEDAECEWEQFEGGMAAFLVALISGSFISRILTTLSEEPSYDV